MLSFNHLLQEVVNEKRCIGLLAAVILGYTLLFGSLFSQNTAKQVQIAVCNLDEGSYGRALVQMLTENEELEVQAQVATAEEAEALLKAEAVTGIVLVPTNFSRQIATGQAARAQLVVNNGNTVLGQAVQLGVQQAIGTLDAQLLAQQRLAKGASFMQAQEQAAAVGLSQRVLDNPTGGYVDFFLPLLILHALQIAVVFIIAPLVCAKKQLWQWQLPLLVQRLLLWSLLAFLLTLVAFYLAYLFFAMQLQLSPKLALIVFTFSLSMTSLAFAVGLWLPRPALCISATLFYIMPSILFSNALWPRSSMDKISLILSYLMPIGYAGDTARTLILRGSLSTSLCFQSLAGLVFFSLLFIALAWLKIQRSGGKVLC